MKYIITIFIASAISMLSFTVNEQMEFYDFFKNIYVQSFNGLERLKSENGDWIYANSVKGYDSCTLQFNNERKVNEVLLSKTHPSAESSEKMMNEVKETFKAMLPEWQYKRTITKNQDGTESIVYTYINEAERDQYPMVELDVVKGDTTYELFVRLYEPKQHKK